MRARAIVLSIREYLREEWRSEMGIVYFSELLRVICKNTSVLSSDGAYTDITYLDFVGETKSKKETRNAAEIVKDISEKAGLNIVRR